MYLIFIISASLIVTEVNSQPAEELIEYFKSDSVRKFRKEWDSHRKPIENAIEAALKETVGVPGLNVYVRKKKETITNGYYHSDNQIKLILKDLRLHTYPRCWLPEVQFSLASNVLKMQTSLSPMIMHAEYSLVRNMSDIIYDPEKQDPLKASPFRFQPVQDTGRVAISMDGCVLSGFIITTLNGESVNLGYQHLKIRNCLYNIEIFREGDDSPPVIARYNLNGDGNGLSINQLVIRQLNDELLPKLQGAMFSFVNTSSVFENKLQEYVENQEDVFKTTSQYLTEVIRKVNKLTIEKNQGVVEMKNYVLRWNDGRYKTNSSKHKDVGEQLTLLEMTLTGLDTLYSSHTGGPYKMNDVMVAEEIRFSSLQVRGYVDIKSSWSDRYSFASIISDLAVDVQLDILQKKLVSASPKYRLKNIQVSSYRRISFAVPSVIFGSAEAMIAGYLLNEVPRLIEAHLWEILPKALQPSNFSDSVEDDPNDPYSICKNLGNDDDDEDDGLNTSDLENALNDSKFEVHKRKVVPKRYVFNKSKKRFKSAHRLVLAQEKAALRAKCRSIKNAQKLKKYRQ